MDIVYVDSSSAAAGLSAPSVHVQEMVAALGARGHRVRLVRQTSRPRSLSGQAAANCAFAIRLAMRLRHERPDWVYQRERPADPFVAFLCRRLGLPCAVEVNGLIVDELRRDGARPWTVIFASRLQAATLCTATAVFVSSRAWARKLQANYRLGAQKVHFVQNGVDLARFAPQPPGPNKQRLGLAPECLVLGYLGALSRNYDFVPTFEALARLRGRVPETRVVLAGAGPRSADVRALAERCGLPDIVLMLGAVPHDEAGQTIAAFDVCLLPASASMVRENDGIFYCMKLAEYTGCGRPILKHDYPGSESHEPLQECSWSCDPDDPGTVDAALLSALSSPQARVAKGCAARRYAEAFLSWDSAAQLVEGVLGPSDTRTAAARPSDSR